MAEIKEVMAWALELGNQAFAEARAGNPGMMNRLGVNKSLSYFLNNVIGNKAITPDQFPAYCPAQFQDIVKLYEDYQKQETISESVDRIGALESKFDALTEMVKKLVEAQEKPVEPVEEPTPTKKPGKKAAKVESVEAVEPIAEPEAEPTEDAPESEA